GRAGDRNQPLPGWYGNRQACQVPRPVPRPTARRPLVRSQPPAYFPSRASAWVAVTPKRACARQSPGKEERGDPGQLARTVSAGVAGPVSRDRGVERSQGSPSTRLTRLSGPALQGAWERGDLCSAIVNGAFVEANVRLAADDVAGALGLGRELMREW